jgi:hypothetical protein
MAYEYDIFFSYKRNVESDEWHERLKEKIRYFVGEEPEIVADPSIKEVRVFLIVKKFVRETGGVPKSLMHCLGLSV